MRIYIYDGQNHTHATQALQRVSTLMQVIMTHLLVHTYTPHTRHTHRITTAHTHTHTQTHATQALQRVSTLMWVIMINFLVHTGEDTGHPLTWWRKEWLHDMRQFALSIVT